MALLVARLLDSRKAVGPCPGMGGFCPSGGCIGGRVGQQVVFNEEAIVPITVTITVVSGGSNHCSMIQSPWRRAWETTLEVSSPADDWSKTKLGDGSPSIRKWLYQSRTQPPRYPLVLSNAMSWWLFGRLVWPLATQWAKKQWDFLVVSGNASPRMNQQA